jgi:hypothetical protein
MKTENINGFIWAILDREEAKEEWQKEISYSLFTLLPDGNNFLISEGWEIDETIIYGGKVGIEIGAKEDLEADYERNNETRTFEDWCLSKIE